MKKIILSLCILINTSCKTDVKETETTIKEELLTTINEIDSIYPVIKPKDWIRAHRNAITTKLFGERKDSLPFTICFVVKNKNDFTFIETSNIGSKTKEEIINYAFKNIEVYESEIDLSNNKAFSSGEKLSCEKIFSKNHLKKIQEMLKADELLISIPRKTCMYAIDKNAKKEDLYNFKVTHSYTWADDSYGNETIREFLIHVKDGEIKGFIEVSEEIMDYGRALFEKRKENDFEDL